MLTYQVLEAFASWLRLKHGYYFSLRLGLYLNIVYEMGHYDDGNTIFFLQVIF